MIFTWILIILLIIISSFLCWVIYLMTQQIEQYEENVEYYQNWYDKFITIIADADTKMKEVDNKGSFSSDDEIGFAYTMNGMASFTLGGPRTTRIFNGLFESLICKSAKL